MSWARDEEMTILDAFTRGNTVRDVVYVAIRETIEEAARRVCDCMHYDGTHARSCLAPKVLAMLEDE